jgi:UDP:flavonoid glycosyltransferase YjiC (YdhE family)
VLREFRLAPAGRSLENLLETDEEVLCTFPELDHYPERKEASYFGPLFMDDQGVEPQWPDGSGTPVFAYLRRNYVALRAAVDELARSGRPVLAVVPGLRDAKAHGPLRISAEPVRVSSVVARCGLGVCHGGHGTVAAMLLAGVPLVLLPEHLEQYVLARRLSDSLCATLVEPGRNPAEFGARLRDAVEKAGSLRGASRFKEQHAAFDRAGQLDTVAGVVTAGTSRQKLKRVS